jgi:hypothetical protein
MAEAPQLDGTKQLEREGRDRLQPRSRRRRSACARSSFAFIFGVLPVAIATGAAAENRQALGTALFFGMIGPSSA